MLSDEGSTPSGSTTSKKGCAAMRGLSFFEGVETVPEGDREESRE